MKPWFASAGLWLVVAAGASGQNCEKAVSAAEKVMCRDPILAQLDAELNQLYAGLRPQLTMKARAGLLTQQRAWLAERNRVCATGEAGCLRTAYGSRVDQLQALSAAAEVSEGKLDDLATVIFKGKWKATSIQDPAGAGHTKEADVKNSLAEAELPQVGAMVSAAPGKICVPGLECRTVAWTRGKLAKVDGSEAIHRVLGLSLTDDLLKGNNGAKESPGYELVPRADGTVWAVFGLCGPNAANCRNAAEVWTPASPDAGTHMHP